MIDTSKKEVCLALFSAEHKDTGQMGPVGTGGSS